MENALRLRDMNVDEAMDVLCSVNRGTAGIDSWRSRHEDHYDHQNSGQFPGQRFPSGGQMPFPPVRIFLLQYVNGVKIEIQSS